MKGLSRTAQFYILIISLSGVLGLLWPPARPLSNPWGFVMFFVVCGLAQLMPVQLFQETSVSVSGAVALAGLLVFGPFYAAWINVAFGVVHYLTMVRPRRHPIYRSTVTIGSVVLGARLAGVAHGFLTSLTSAHSPEWPLLIALATGAVYFAINVSIITLGMALEKGQPISCVWGLNYNWLTPNYLALMFLGWGIARVYTSLGTIGLFIFLIPLAMARYSFKLYVQSMLEVRQRNAQLQEANERLNVMHRISRSLLTSLDPQETLDLIIKALAEQMGFPVALVILKEDRGYEITRSHGAGDDLQFIRQHLVNDIWLRIHLDDGPYVATAETHPRLIEMCRGGGSPLSVLYFLPLVVDGRNVGMIGAGSDTAWNAAQQQEFFIFVAQASTALGRAQAHHSAQMEAILDPLTGLYNHRYFQESIRQQIEEITLRGGYLSLLMLDINHFKQLNDTYGHVAGDKVLKQVARLLRDNLRQQDIPCRYGGDEMAILLTNVDKARAIEIGERIHQAVRSYAFQIRHPRDGISRVQVTVSIGISTFPETVDNRKALVEGADEACYRAKQLGGGVAYHSPSSDVMPSRTRRISLVK